MELDSKKMFWTVFLGGLALSSLDSILYFFNINIKTYTIGYSIFFLYVGINFQYHAIKSFKSSKSYKELISLSLFTWIFVLIFFYIHFKNF